MRKNECAYGSMFYRGADYIKSRDSRPIHYQGIALIEETNVDEYYTDRIDILGCFYPKIDIFDKYLSDEREKRPMLLSEYLHAMGNSCGGLKEYWDKMTTNDRFIGGFVWEWCDHAILKGDKFLYGGDFKELDHDGNFCVDGLVTPDRKAKSGLLELKAVYENLRTKELETPVCEFPQTDRKNAVSYSLNLQGEMCSVGNVEFKKPVSINILRAYLDNDIHNLAEWKKYEHFAMQTYEKADENGKTTIKGKITTHIFRPIMEYTLIFDPFNGGIDISFDYKVNDYVSYLPRIGLEFAVDKKYGRFTYKGYGETESYIDKYQASSYGQYTSDVQKNYTDYIKPQECGSHCMSTELLIEDLLSITAKKPFSFSVLPYSTKELMAAKHNFELKKSDTVYVNLDIEMSGIGSASCGPDLPEQYKAKKQGMNTFRLCLCK